LLQLPERDIIAVLVLDLVLEDVVHYGLTPISVGPETLFPNLEVGLGPATVLTLAERPVQEPDAGSATKLEVSLLLLVSHPTTLLTEVDHDLPPFRLRDK